MLLNARAGAYLAGLRRGGDGDVAPEATDSGTAGDVAARSRDVAGAIDQRSPSSLRTSTGGAGSPPPPAAAAAASRAPPPRRCSRCASTLLCAAK